jgi:hypothetical protein
MSDPFRDVAEVAKAEKDPEYDYWKKELDLARKREKKWRKEAKMVTDLYEGEKASENSFNILYSNTETLLPAIYNNLPRPVVQATFLDPDPLADAAAKALERVISSTANSQNVGYDKADRLFQQAVLGGLVPGRGSTRWFYDAKFAPAAKPVVDGENSADEGAEQDGADEEAFDASKEPFNPAEAGGKQVIGEYICGKDLDYDNLLLGYARRWVDVPWIGFEHFMY